MTNKRERADTVGPKICPTNISINPIHSGIGEQGDEKVEEEARESDPWEETAERVEDLETRLAEHFEDQHGKDGNPPHIIKEPMKPTYEVWERHQATHTPFESWCPHCVAARDARRGHPSKGRRGRLVPDTEGGDGPTKVSMDYMVLHDRVGKYKESTYNPPYLVVIEHKFGRCWTYQVPNKGVNDNAYWVPKRVLQDLENNGLGKTRILLKSDQEPAIVCVPNAIQDLKPEIVPINSPIGESTCNGRVENTIRRVQEKIRVLRHQLENGIGEKLPDD